MAIRQQSGDSRSNLFFCVFFFHFGILRKSLHLIFFLKNISKRVSIKTSVDCACV